MRMQPERFCVYVFSVAEDGIEASVSERVGVWQGLTFEEGTTIRGEPPRKLLVAGGGVERDKHLRMFQYRPVFELRCWP